MGVFHFMTEPTKTVTLEDRFPVQTPSAPLAEVPAVFCGSALRETAKHADFVQREAEAK